MLISYKSIYLRLYKAWSIRMLFPFSSKMFYLKGMRTLLRIRNFSTTTVRQDKHECQLLVLGGGSGGCSMAAKFASKLGKNKVIIIDPADKHYYQPMFTLVGGGMKTLEQCGKSMSQVLPPQAKWLKDEVVQIEPENNKVFTKTGDVIQYDYMIVALGIKLNYHKIPGLVEGLKMDDSGVCSIYSPLYVKRTYKILQSFQKGNMVFTFPQPPVKCPGAPLKIVLISEDYVRKNGKRSGAHVIYNSALPVIFGVKKYADALWKVVKSRDVEVNLRRNLKEIRPKQKLAVFEDLEESGKSYEIEYSMLHVAPPQGPVEVLQNTPQLTDASGFLNVNKETLQHVKFSNIYGIGDCTNAPTSKTAAAVAAQSGIVKSYLGAALDGVPAPEVKYDGYTSCPLVTGYGKCIMAEFDYNLEPLETFPIDQGVESSLMYTMKAHVIPQLYWNAMLKGMWEGPKFYRKAMHLGMGR